MGVDRTITSPVEDLTVADFILRVQAEARAKGWNLFIELIRNPSGLQFAYYETMDFITLDGRIFVKGLPAKILRDILIAMVTEGRREFTFWEFKKKHDIHRDRANLNFEIRLKRIQEKLQKDCPGLRMELLKRGLFRMASTGPVQFYYAKES